MLWWSDAPRLCPRVASNPFTLGVLSMQMTTRATNTNRRLHRCSLRLSFLVHSPRILIIRHGSVTAAPSLVGGSAALSPLSPQFRLFQQNSKLIVASLYYHSTPTSRKQKDTNLSRRATKQRRHFSFFASEAVVTCQSFDKKCACKDHSESNKSAVGGDLTST